MARALVRAGLLRGFSTAAQSGRKNLAISSLRLGAGDLGRAARGASTAARSARCAGLALGGVGCPHSVCSAGAPGGARGRMPRKRRSQYGLKDILICCAIFAGIFITIFLIGKLWEWVQASYAKRQRRLRKEAFLEAKKAQ